MARKKMWFSYDEVEGFRAFWTSAGARLHAGKLHDEVVELDEVDLSGEKILICWGEIKHIFVTNDDDLSLDF